MSRRIRFNTLTKNEEQYYSFIKAEYNDIPTQLSVVNSLELNDAGKERLRKALQTPRPIRYVNANNTARNARRSIVHTMNRSNRNVYRTLKALHPRNLTSQLRTLNSLQIPQTRKNAMERAMMQSQFKQRLTPEESQGLAQILAKYEDPYMALKYVDELELPPASARKIRKQIQYLMNEAINVNRWQKLAYLHQLGKKNNLENLHLLDVVGSSGAFD